MDFKFRAGEERPLPPPSSYLSPLITDAYFTAQSLPPVGYFGGDLNPMQNPTLPRRGRESLRRDLEEESLRLEMIAKESLRKRALLLEVRRDLEFDRELEFRMQAAQFSLAGGKAPPPPIAAAAASASSHLSSISLLPSFKIEEKKEWFCALCKVTTTSEHDLNVHLQARKHKENQKDLLASKRRGGNDNNKKGAASSSPTPLPKKANESNNYKQPHLKYYCKHCKANCTSEVTLESHLRGNRHLERMRELKGGGAREANTKQGKEGVMGTTNLNQSKLKRPQVGGRSEQQKQQQQVPKTEKKNVVVVKKHLFYCEYCELNCNSEFMLAEHLGGKRHLARLEELVKSRGR